MGAFLLGVGLSNSGPDMIVPGAILLLASFWFHRAWVQWLSAAVVVLGLLWSFWSLRGMSGVPATAAMPVWTSLTLYLVWLGVVFREKFRR